TRGVRRHGRHGYGSSAKEKGRPRFGCKDEENKESGTAVTLIVLVAARRRRSTIAGALRFSREYSYAARTQDANKNQLGAYCRGPAPPRFSQVVTLPAYSFPKIRNRTTKCLLSPPKYLRKFGEPIIEFTTVGLL